MTHYNPNLNLVNDNVYTKFGLNLFIRSQDIEQKPHSDINQGHLLCCKFTKNNTLQSQLRSCQCMCTQTMVKFCPFIPKILTKNQILKSIKGRTNATLLV